jgi:hypothetical protein
MNLLKTLVYCAVVAVPTAAGAAEPAKDAGAPNNPCSALHWNAKFLQTFPRAALACQDVQVKDGVNYARFDARVAKVNPDSVEVEVLNVARTAVGTAVWRTSPDQDMEIGGKDAKAKDLKRGDELSFWVPESAVKMEPSANIKSKMWGKH